MKNKHFKRLGIKPTNDIKKIKKAYRQKALLLHPDRGGNEEDFKKLNKSYTKILKNTVSDYIYDTNTICVFSDDVIFGTKEITINQITKELEQKLKDRYNKKFKDLMILMTDDKIDYVVKIDDFELLIDYFCVVVDKKLVIQIYEILEKNIFSFLDTHTGGRIYDG